MMRTGQQIAIVSSVLMCLFVASQSSAKESPRAIRKLNDGWRFVPGARENAQWQPVTLPHTWNVHDTLDDEPGYRRGVSWYRRELNFEKSFTNRRVFLHFEGANHVAEVFINGKFVGKHIGGYTAFSFDVTDFLRPNATNVIEVSVDNTLIRDNPPIDGDFNMYGGIYRDVWLITTDPVHLGSTDVAGTGIAITTPEVSAETASVEIVGSVINKADRASDLEISSAVLDPRGKSVAVASSTVRVDPKSHAEFRQTSIKISRPMLWSPGTPNRYRVVTNVRRRGRTLDTTTNPLGFRWFKFDADQGFFLNGKHLKLRGTNRHQDRAGMGNAVPDELHVRDLEIIKENGFNFLRLAHYPQDPSVLEAADRLGLLIWEEIPVVNEIHVSETFNENAKTMLREMIRQHRNHPSIIIWGYMNEVFLGRKKTDEVIQGTVRLARELENICRTEDPDRVTAIAFDGGATETYYSSGLADVTQVVGWNLYQGWYSGKFEDFGKFVDEFHRKYPYRPVLISEYGANADRRVHSVIPKRFDSSIEWQQMFHESYVSQIESRAFIAGSAIWNQFDFGSEFRGETIPHINQKGMYTFDRQPKDVSYFYRANYSRDPVLHIAVRDWRKRSGPTTQTVVVYTNLERVELLNNGVSLGTVAVGPDKKASWQVNFAPGRNVLRSFGRHSGKDLSDQTEVDFFDPASTSLIAINCGSNTEVTDSDGTIWQADIPATGPRAWLRMENKATYPLDTRVNILGTDDDAIFQTMRRGANEYVFRVPDGRYEIELRFAEPMFKEPRHRIFSMHINREPFIKRLDLVAEGGYMTAVTRKTTVTATGTNGIVIEVVDGGNLSTISGIKVKRID